MIPEFVDGLNLPIGGHFCTVAEVEDRFVFNEGRRTLFQALIDLLRLARRCGFLRVLLGGSFPTGGESPSDLDITWFCKPGTTKISVERECIEIMEDSSDRGNFLFVPFDEGTGPDSYPAKLAFWAERLGWCAKTNMPRGVLLLSLENDDDRLR